MWPATRVSKANRSKFKPVIVGTNAAKDSIRWRLALEEPGPGYMHFQARRDLGWYAQIVAERLVTKVVAGRRFTVWDLPKGKANEALDCRVYAYAALSGLLQRGLELNAMVDTVSPAPEISQALAKKKADERAAKGKPEWLATTADQVAAPTSTKPARKANPFTSNRRR